MIATTGVPEVDEVKRVVASSLFRDMEDHNREFLSRHEDVLSFYRERWSADPLHAWSRRWEYPFIFERLRTMSHPGARVLDAGAGATFFPFYLAARIDGIEIEAVDTDPRMRAVYDEAADPAVHFALEDITDMAYPDDHFDAAYSVSVLEHIPDRDAVLRELARVLKPGGALVLTVDVSLDGRADIPVARADELIDALAERFEPVDPPERVAAAVRSKSALTTDRVKVADRPTQWTLRARARRLVREHRSPFAMTPPITVYGTAWRRRA